MCVLVVILAAAAAAGGWGGVEGRSSSSERDPLCGYRNCPRTEAAVLNVHIVAHTHDDVGWLKTLDQYYYGSKNTIQKAGVQYILDSVVKELWEDPTRKFTYVETAFLWKWWERATEAVRAKVRQLVEEERLVFAGGAWSMNDEAASHYQSTVDQFTWGLSKVNATFGECALPRVGWQIDPFGHSREFASALAMMGYDGLFLGRIDYQDKAARLRDRRMEMLWRGDDDLGAASDIFTGVLYNTYSPPAGFCFDVLCDDEPIVDDVDSPAYNVEEKVAAFLEHVVTQARHYRTTNVLVTMGGDFTYQDASMWYNNLDKLILYTNRKAAKDGLAIKLFYSNPNCYLKAVRDANPTLPIKQDDFFPYASDPHAYWTGYFTSRPTTKYFERQGNAYLQMAKQLQVLTGLQRDNQRIVDKLKSAMGVMQHHDAITGTEKQHVAHDYERILNDGIESSLLVPRQAFTKMMQGGAEPPLFSFDRCRLNESSCDTSERSSRFVVTLYNMLAWAVKEPVRIPVCGDLYEVYTPNGDKIESQVVDIPRQVVDIPTRESRARREVVFVAWLQPLMYKSFYVRSVAVSGGSRGVSGGTDEYPEIQQPQGLGERGVGGMSDSPRVVERPEEYLLMENEHISIRVDAASGQIASVASAASVANVTLSYGYYPACVGDNEVPENRSSGAYIFRPNATEPVRLQSAPPRLIRGAVVTELRTSYEGGVLSAVRLYAGLSYVEVDWLVGAVDVDDQVGKEYVVRYDTGLTTNGEFYTDSNGRQWLKRRTGERPQWNVTIAEQVGGNYYPVVGAAAVEGGGTRLAVLTDRAQGGSSLQEGQLELMLHRRLLHDDAFGVGEALNETAGARGAGLAVRGSHRLVLSPTRTRSDNEARQTLQMHLRPAVFLSDAAHVDLRDWLQLDNCFSFLNAMPEGVHLLTLEPWGEGGEGGQLLLRLENYLSSSVRVELTALLRGVRVKGARETRLAGTRPRGKWTWTTEGEFSRSFNEQYGGFGEWRGAREVEGGRLEGLAVIIQGKEIRTFVVDYEFVGRGRGL